MSYSAHPHDESEQGFALLLVIFVISLATILVVDFADKMNAYQRSSRGYTEQVQGMLMLKSAVNLGKLLIEAPKPEETKDEDWLFEAWNNIGSVPSIPLEGILGELRLMIVDDDGKIDVNAVQSLGGFPAGGLPQAGQQGGSGLPVLDNTTYWRNVLKELFDLQGFRRESYPDGSYRTLGNIGFESGDQVAVIADFVDNDSESSQVQGFDGTGIEGNADRAWFYNRPLKNMAELAAVPGMTLERVQRVAPFLKVSPTAASLSNGININTAPFQVLLALGFPQSQAEEIVQRRLTAPFTRDILPTLTAGDPNLATRLKTKSGEFSAYARIRMPTRTFWVHAVIGAQDTGRGRRAVVRSYEYY